jgi:hypothetical protein
MERFETDVTFPDFFCQVPQFLTEVQVCVSNCGPNRPYPEDSSRARYGLRLESWWQAWWKRRSAELQRKCQREDHEYLEEQLQVIKCVLKAGNEVMKLELWIRWQPVDHRYLRLWASSTGTWPEVSSMRTAGIKADSSNASVRAFCLGRPEIYPIDDNGVWLSSDRWNTYLCVPIRAGEAGGELPVAVISLASQTLKDKSTINEGRGVALDGVVRKMLAVGTRLATPERSRP